jgi:hypothetical protein
MERGLQNLPVFLFRTAIALGRPPLKCHNEVRWKISHDQLGHGRDPQVIGDLNATSTTFQMLALLSSSTMADCSAAGLQLESLK